MLGDDVSSVVLQDNYYYDRPEAQADNLRFNFDHPDAIDFGLLGRDLKALKNGRAIASPRYDFARHIRIPGEHSVVEPRPLVLVDGILILASPQLRAVFDAAVFVSCPAATRLARRLRRDVAERGREPANVRAQFRRQVEPMHRRFVEPSSVHATRIIGQADLARETRGESADFLTLCGA